MRNGFKIYLKHFALIIALMGIMFATEGGVSMFFLLTGFFYFWSFFFGAFLNKGPLKSIGLALLRDQKEEMDELNTKQPWE